MENSIVLIQISGATLMMMASNILFKKNHDVGSIIVANISAALVAIAAFNSVPTITTVLTLLASAVALFISITVAFFADRGYKTFSVIFYVLIVTILISLFV